MKHIFINRILCLPRISKISRVARNGDMQHKCCWPRHVLIKLFCFSKVIKVLLNQQCYFPRTSWYIFLSYSAIHFSQICSLANCKAYCKLIGSLRNHDGNGDRNAKLLLFQNFRFKRFLVIRSNLLPMRDSEAVLFKFTTWKQHLWRSVPRI